MNHYQTIIFDVDGTIFDPKIGMRNSINYALDKMGVTQKNLDNFDKFIGPAIHNSFKDFYGMSPEHVAQAVDHYRDYLSKYGLCDFIIFDEMPTLFNRLQKAGKKLYIASMRPPKFTREILKHFQLEEYFDDVYGSNPDGTGSTKKEMIDAIFIKNPTIEKSRAVMVGDRDQDVMGATEAGIDSIVVKFGFGTKEDFIQYPPTYFAETVGELAKLIL